jgi:hypothetical protein
VPLAFWRLGISKKWVLNMLNEGSVYDVNN